MAEIIQEDNDKMREASHNIPSTHTYSMHTHIPEGSAMSSKSAESAYLKLALQPRVELHQVQDMTQGSHQQPNVVPLASHLRSTKRRDEELSSS